jgi:hypothetical protein
VYRRSTSRRPARALAGWRPRSFAAALKDNGSISATDATKGIARRARDAVVKMSRSYDATLRTAQRVVDST